jgi:hypothetical protein
MARSLLRGANGTAHANARARPREAEGLEVLGVVFTAPLGALGVLVVEEVFMADPDPQTMIDTLTATYQTLAAEIATTRSMAARSITMRDLEDVRKQLTYWEQRRDARTKRAFTIGRPVR